LDHNTTFKIPDSQITVTDKKINFDLTHRSEDTRSFFNGTVVSAMGLEATCGPVNINQPIFFSNYSTLTDENPEQEYCNGIKPHLKNVNAGFVLNNVESKIKASHFIIPAEKPASKVPWVHRQLELVYYPSPRDWVSASAHPDIFQFYHYQFFGAGNGFNIAVQESVFDLPKPLGTRFKPVITGPAILHNFNLAREPFEPLLSDLGRELIDLKLGKLAYAGRTIARPYMVLDNGKQIIQKAWMDGSVIISLNRPFDTDRILGLESCARLIKIADNNAFTVFA